MAEFVNWFEGTASSYARYRPDYPLAVYELLAREAPLSGSSSVLDLGCGPGLVALALAHRVRSVTGVDSDGDMLREAARAAESGGIQNATWVLSTAESFEDSPGTYRLVVIASAFHWMDRPTVAANAHALLEPGGLLALLGNPTPLLQIRQRQGVGRVIAEVQDRWFDQDAQPAVDQQLSRPEEVLRAGPFDDTALVYVPCEQLWDVERFLGFLRSTSWRPDQRLGGRFAEFAAELDAAITTVEPTGEWLLRGDVEVILSRR